ncbi:MAG: lipoprotein-releasing ABC transporter ATP-binding protein LolD [Candidatus Endonucleobacter bathymodioli]|uniref:Lipoprotein-releasing system ATP-binding protein LolD n=1 Tax=Candidatus Endonucleibacter bathymodioli TaxID=539814 RepID=A0AA90ST03_9GAMM|nr:lipoprotein-releasing ABC transporter ATP-binding protein LolD [Candidatus Endonucleobacter bathymodioli]
MSNINVPVLECRSLAKWYDEGPEKIKVLSNLNFSIFSSERVAVVGASGSGKSTLLQLLAGLDEPTSGSVSICGMDIATLSDHKKDIMRNRHLGFVYQFHHLLPEFTARENVAMPLLLRKEVSTKNAGQRSEEMLNAVGLSKRTNHKPSELSGGERQRVAIARALVTQPNLVLMDEPTGNLDLHTANKIHDLMTSLSKELTTSFIVVTHDMQLAGQMDHSYRLWNGELTYE